MANPRRSSYSLNINDDGAGAGAGLQQSSSSSSSSSYFSSSPLFISLKHWLKKPHALPFLLVAFLLLAWISLFLQSSHSSSSPSSLADRLGDGQRRKHDDREVNLVRFPSESGIAKDDRGWLLDPVSLALEHGLKGGAVSCGSVHVGEIRPGKLRGNHRHNACNETLVIWGARTLFRLENHQIADKGYAEVIVSDSQVAIATSPSGTAHAILNVDSVRSTFFIGCQDHGNSSSQTDYRVWDDL